MVFAVREPAEAGDFAGLPELQLEGLPELDARSLLETVVPGLVDARVRDRILAETRGNPLALLELPRGLAPAELAGGFALPDARPLANRIEHTFLDHLLRSTNALLRRLEGEANAAGERLPRLRQRSRDAQRDRHVAVVAARVHRSIRRSERQPRLLIKRQSVHIRAPEECRSRAGTSYNPRYAGLVDGANVF